MYGTNYCRHGENVVGSEEKVPIKWMAPESIERSIYNEKTDVVSVFTCLFGRNMIMNMLWKWVPLSKSTLTALQLSCIFWPTEVLALSIAISLAHMQSFLCVVVIWSDLLGGVHLWQSTLCWNFYLSLTERTALWPQTGQTKQCCLFRWNVKSNVL